jgi:site-specific DNA recombinase
MRGPGRPLSEVMTKQRRAIGIIRVSQTAGRDGESFISPEDQRDRIKAACDREGLSLIYIADPELDVSGGKPLDQRPGLGPAVHAVEAGEADVIVAGYFNRLFRSLKTQAEAVDRVEAAGGRVLAVDFGDVSHKTATKWLTSNMMGMFAEYERLVAAERGAEAQRRAVERGVAPWPNVPPGYLRGDDGRLVPDPATAPAVAEAFRLRAGGATIAEVRAHLAAQGIERSYHGVQALLRSRVVLGEINFGKGADGVAKLSNTNAHDPIVNPEVWARAQLVSVSRGRRAKSERLLARLEVLRCGGCGSRMVVGTQRQNGRDYPFYRCGRVREDCGNRVTIGAGIAERVVSDAVREALADVEGRASAERSANRAREGLEATQAALDAAIRVLADFGDEGAARERLAELRRARDEARERAEQQLGGQPSAAKVINAVGDWDRLTIEERRALIRTVVERATVSTAGRGAERITVELFRE